MQVGSGADINSDISRLVGKAKDAEKKRAHELEKASGQVALVLVRARPFVIIKGEWLRPALTPEFVETSLRRAPVC